MPSSILKSMPWERLSYFCEFGEDDALRCAFTPPYGVPCRCTHDKWNAILDQMADGFLAELEDEADMTYIQDAVQERAVRIAAGLEAFAKHHRALWI